MGKRLVSSPHPVAIVSRYSSISRSGKSNPDVYSLTVSNETIFESRSKTALGPDATRSPPSYYNERSPSRIQSPSQEAL